MYITKNNFEEHIPLVRETINNSNFIAIDTEFTGLYTENNNIYNSLNIEELFSRLVKNIKSFTPIQYGISCFKEKDGEWIVRSYNFYIFPRSENRELYILSQGISLEFLSKYNFNFNKWIAEGVDYDDFSKIIKLLVASKKMIVGHNCLMDILFTINYFYSELSENIVDFKKIYPTIFPYIADTKYLVKSGKFNVENLPDTHLSTVYNYLLNQGSNIKNPDYTNELPHEAAYDAHMAGVVFIRLLEKTEHKNIGNMLLNISDEKILDHFKPLLNKFNVMTGMPSNNLDTTTNNTISIYNRIVQFVYSYIYQTEQP